MAEPITLQIITKQAEPWYISVPISIGPYVILAAAALWAVWYLYPKLRQDLFPRIDKISGYGLQIDLAASNVAAIYKSKSEPIPPLPETTAVASRLARSRDRIRGKSIVWIDGHPENNAGEIALLKIFDVKVEQTKTWNEGLQVIAARPPSVVISSWLDGEWKALAEGISKLSDRPPMIIYTSKAHIDEPHPRSVFGLTDQPTELLHLVVDAIERDGA